MATKVMSALFILAVVSMAILMPSKTRDSRDSRDSRESLNSVSMQNKFSATIISFNQSDENSTMFNLSDKQYIVLQNKAMTLLGGVNIGDSLCWSSTAQSTSLPMTVYADRKVALISDAMDGQMWLNAENIKNMGGIETYYLYKC
jgi:hypothetical protein